MRILLIDDDKLFHESFRATIESDEVSCLFATNLKETIEWIETSFPNVIFLDLDLGDEYGLDILVDIKKYEIPVCILSGTATIRTTIEALKLGAVDLIEKPISKIGIIERVEKYASKTEPKEFVSEWRSEKMKECENMVHYLANTPAKVLLRGETGVGKEVIAKKLHELSDRKNEPFIAVNCGAIPENLVEHELFGSMKGSFTGSVSDHNGLIKDANNGTLFLDEVADLSLSMQVKLLRFLQEGEVRSLGSSIVDNVDVRVIAATHKDLEQMVKDGDFREDLYFRLNVFTIDIPPLRERREDLPVLIEKIVDQFKFQYKNDLEFRTETIQMLQHYEWKGNVRELVNLIERLMLLCQKPVSPEDLPKNFQTEVSTQTTFDGKTLKDARANFERDFIVSALKQEKSLKEVSERLGVERTTLYKKMRTLGITYSES